PQRVLAADRDQAVDLAPGQRLAGALPAAVERVGVGARRAQDRAAAGQYPPGVVEVELHRVVLQHAGPPVPEAEHVVAVGAHGLADDGAYDRVEAGAVAAAGQDPHARHARGLLLPAGQVAGDDPGGG